VLVQYCRADVLFVLRIVLSKVSTAVTFVGTGLNRLTGRAARSMQHKVLSETAPVFLNEV
jgi:hypothetical protein